MASRGVTVLEDGGAAIVVDDRGWPIVVGTWFGSAGERLVVDYFAHTDKLLEAAKVAGEHVVMVTDTYATAAPVAKVRTRIAELSRAQTARYGANVAESVTILENAVIRGVFTALSWIDPTIGKTTNVASFHLAMDRAVAALRSVGRAGPAALPSRYRDPGLKARTG